MDHLRLGSSGPTCRAPGRVWPQSLPTRRSRENNLMELRDKIAQLMPQAKDELAELVSCKSVADPRQFPPEECAKAAEWVMAKFSQVGFTGLQLVTTSDGSRTVYGERPGPAGARTVLLYAHYDVQPSLNDDMWQTPPFELT